MRETNRYTRDTMCVISDVPRGWPSCEVIVVSNEEYYGGLGLGLGSVYLGLDLEEIGKKTRVS